MTNRHLVLALHKELRTKTSAHLAIKLRICPTTLSRIYAGKIAPTANVILAIYDRSEMSIEAIRALIAQEELK